MDEWRRKNRNNGERTMGYIINVENPYQYYDSCITDLNDWISRAKCEIIPIMAGNRTEDRSDPKSE